MRLILTLDLCGILVKLMALMIITDLMVSFSKRESCVCLNVQLGSYLLKRLMGEG